MKKFKKVYIEITNSCNLKCDFCIGNKRKIKFMTFDEFIIVLDKIKDYTNYLYFHILGEPLLHPDINKFIDYASNRGFFVNITTNGYLIDKISNNKNIRQLNISLHSFDIKYGISLNDYLDNIFNVINKLDKTYVSLRVWINNKFNNDIFDYICRRFACDFNRDNFDFVSLSNRVFLNSFHEFIWPDFNNNFYSDKGKCYGLINHIGILSDGRIVPCCLDSNGDICLGNIFSDSLETILKSDRVNNMISNFKKNRKCETLCCHCNFLETKKED